VDCEQAFVATPLLDPDHSVGRQPIMSMYYVEMPNKVLHFEHPIHKCPTHVIDVIHEIMMRRVCATVIMNIIYQVMTPLTRCPASEHMHFVSFSRQHCCQFRNMGAHATYGNRVLRFPR
jgi:hypothetical protein